VKLRAGASPGRRKREQKKDNNYQLPFSPNVLQDGRDEVRNISERADYTDQQAYSLCHGSQPMGCSIKNEVLHSQIVVLG
jgi:hypothetical protein